MTFRRFAATTAVLGAFALVGAPIAAAAPSPAPKPADKNSVRAVPGTKCNVGQLRASIDRSSPGLVQKLEQAAGGPKEFADIATSDPLTRQFRVAGLAFQQSGVGFSLLNDQANVERAVSDAYRNCASAKK
ncbi:hypothetical protein [Tsukamurella sp. 1534]|uniref:hypothetical protein n=1 Tax=Tsukamurella sp. 1534 TaxID=1151061 RepID=UPI0002FA77EF|nr:hypothetical protein [Tsukamurella sp. 1534]